MTLAHGFTVPAARSFRARGHNRRIAWSRASRKIEVARVRITDA
jgi:hypothetical protein